MQAEPRGVASASGFAAAGDGPCAIATACQAVDAPFPKGGIERTPSSLRFGSLDQKFSLVNHWEPAKSFDNAMHSMFPDDSLSLATIGNELLEHANLEGEPIRLPITTQLFPYLLLAARKMTTREMSAWLEQTRGIKLSNVAIAKGLKRPELHLKRLAEFVQFPASFLSAVYRRLTVQGILYGADNSGRTTLEELADHILHDPEGVSESIQGALDTIQEVWAPIPDEVKYMCRPYFEFAKESDDDDDSEESDD